MSEPSVEPGVSLVFDWAPPKGEKLAIAAFLAGSAGLHAVCFYLFQVIYPPAVGLLPPPARVSLITPDSEDGRTILQWVDAEDPALASATMRPPDSRARSLPALEHIPSYRTEEPQLKHAPALNPETAAPTSHPPGPVPPANRQPSARWPNILTHLSLSEELMALGPPTSPGGKFTASNRESPENLRFRIGVDPLGGVRYCFRLNSSGDPALDEQARQHLVLSRFRARPAADSKTEANLVWGIATVEWGNDVLLPERVSSPATP